MVGDINRLNSIASLLMDVRTIRVESIRYRSRRVMSKDDNSTFTLRFPNSTFTSIHKVLRERCGVKEDVVTNILKSMLRWFVHVERMNGSRLTKGIYRCEWQPWEGTP